MTCSRVAPSKLVEIQADNGDRFDPAPVRTLCDQAHGRGEGVVRLVLQGPEKVLELTCAFQAPP